MFVNTFFVGGVVIVRDYYFEKIDVENKGIVFLIKGKSVVLVFFM